MGSHSRTCNLYYEYHRYMFGLLLIIVLPLTILFCSQQRVNNQILIGNNSRILTNSYATLKKRAAHHDERLERLIKVMVDNAYARITERNKWLGPGHLESKQFLQLVAPALYMMFSPVYTCVWDLEKLPDCEQAHDGGKWLCGLGAIAKTLEFGRASTCIVYSFGSRGDFVFENRVRTVAPGCEIYTFDPTWRPFKNVPNDGNGIYTGSATVGNTPYTKYINTYGLAGADLEAGAAEGGGLTFAVRRLETIMSSFQHTHIDILKIDIEGSEWPFLAQVDWSTVRAGQIQIELHPRSEHNAEYFLGVFAKLEKAGYLMFSIEPVTKSNLGQVEIAFIHKDWRPWGFLATGTDTPPVTTASELSPFIQKDGKVVQ